MTWFVTSSSRPDEGPELIGDEFHECPESQSVNIEPDEGG
jgi:hypothetical protein